MTPGFGGESIFKNVVHPLQHHPTMQTLLSTANDNILAPIITTTTTTTTAPGNTLVSLSSSGGLQHQQPHLHHDFRPGVVFEYYEGEWDWIPNFDEMRPDYAGIVGNFMIDDTTEQDLFRPRYSHQTARRQFKEPGNFAVRFTTHIDIIQDGVYSFWLSSNDGSVLYVANTLVVENDGIHYATEAEGRILLQVGKHAVMVEFFHKNGKMLEGFRSTGPSLVVSYRAPGPIWSFGLKAGPKKIIKSSNLFYNHGDVRLKNLLREFGVEEYSTTGGSSEPMSPLGGSNANNGIEEQQQLQWRQNNTGGGSVDQQQQQQQQYGRPTRHRIMSGDDMGVIQPSTRELHVQMENAKTTIRDLEQIIRDQAESHKKKMTEFYNVLQDTQSQVDRLIDGLKGARLFETPRTMIPYHYHPSTWRGTVASVYLDAQEEYPCQDAEQDKNGENSSTDELYFFSMALSVKMNSEMMGKKTPEYTSTNVQKLYEDCAILSKVPVEGWPGFEMPTFDENDQHAMMLRIRGPPSFHIWTSIITSRCHHVRSLSLSTASSPKRHVLVVKDLVVSPDESGMRLDRFLRHRLAQDKDTAFINNSLLSKWLRKRQVKLLQQQQQAASHQDQDGTIDRVETIILNATTVTQGSIKTEAGQEDYPEKPRIVHRLDKTTSGLLILARTRKAAQDLTRRFHDDGTIATMNETDDDEEKDSSIRKKV
ncbi:hypothetical protein BGZ65_009949 [Modicella reniformis]|uniref:PA14 domain-containing protein n=1 Tax=Modicella reniformis TaxID=1440133 RepID=A0A9P6MK31_9FUNG|nr:hypothetical protein BGZ65_009949 [Modicella reniformis]